MQHSDFQKTRATFKPITGQYIRVILFRYCIHCVLVKQISFNHGGLKLGSFVLQSYSAKHNTTVHGIAKAKLYL